MKVHYILPVRRCAYPNIQRMIAQQIIKAAPEARLQHNQLRGNLYKPTYVIPLEPLTDQMVKVMDYHLATDLYRLPSAEYSALVRSVPAFRQPPDLTKILQATSQHPADYVWITSPKSRYETQIPILSLPNEVAFTATWDPGRWALLERHGEWFLVLWFDLLCIGGGIKGTADVALDLGASPLVCAVCPDGFVEDVESQLPATLSQFADLFRIDRALHNRVEFELQRATLLRFTLFLMSYATTVYTEDLTYRDMDKTFVRWARRTGLLDWHESWLPNRLAAAGIPLEKVDSRGTSQCCSACQHPHGQRYRSEFHCPRCGNEIDAHENAARNILLRGQAKGAQWQHAHIRTRQRRGVIT